MRHSSHRDTAATAVLELFFFVDPVVVAAAIAIIVSNRSSTASDCPRHMLVLLPAVHDTGQMRPIGVLGDLLRDNLVALLACVALGDDLARVDADVRACGQQGADACSPRVELCPARADDVHCPGIGDKREGKTRKDLHSRPCKHSSVLTQAQLSYVVNFYCNYIEIRIVIKCAVNTREREGKMIYSESCKDCFSLRSIECTGSRR